MITPITPASLKRGYVKNQPQGYFFCPDTMSFFGDTMSNFKVLNFDSQYWRLVRKRPTPAMYPHIGNGWLFDKITFAVKPLV